MSYQPALTKSGAGFPVLNPWPIHFLATILAERETGNEVSLPRRKRGKIGETNHWSFEQFADCSQFAFACNPLAKPDGNLLAKVSVIQRIGDEIPPDD